MHHVGCCGGLLIQIFIIVLHVGQTNSRFITSSAVNTNSSLQLAHSNLSCPITIVFAHKSPTLWWSGVFLIVMNATMPKKKKSKMSMRCRLNACQNEIGLPVFVTTFSPKMTVGETDPTTFGHARRRRKGWRRARPHGRCG